MGVESSTLAGCTLEDPLPESTSHQQDWKIHPAKRSDGSKVSVFVHKHDDKKSQDNIYQHAVKQLKVLRHPTILKFFASCNNVDSTYLITEQVKPLELVIEMLSPEEICAGMYNLVEALSFLHDRGGVSHNNVCMSSIYVSNSDGGWRLGGMEHLCKFENATLQFLAQSKHLRNTQAIPPEEKEEGVKTSIAPSIGHARDAYGFGMLALTLLEYLGDLGSITAEFTKKIEELFLNPNPKLRPKMITLLSDAIFKNDFLDIMSFLNNLTLKSEGEKNTFFEGLASRLYHLPSQLVASRLVTPLLNSFVMAEPVAVSLLFPHLLSPRTDSRKCPEFLPDRINPILPQDMFQRHMIPVLVQVFMSREMHVRTLLLQYFSCYVELFDEETLKKTILPQLLMGLKDHHTNLVAASLRALADLVHLLGPAVVVGGERIKYFVEGRPKFPEKTSKSSLMSSIPHLTAVSGVITIPGIETSPARQSQIPVGGGEKIRLEEPETAVVEAEDAMVVAAKKAERERRREEMKMRNEQRRREREEKKKLMQKESSEKAPLSPTRDKPTSLGQRLSPDGSIDIGSLTDDMERTVSQTSSNDCLTPAVDQNVDSNEMNKVLVDSPDSSDDWSDWEDTGAAKHDQPIEQPHSTDLGETPKRISQSDDVIDTRKESWSSNWSKDTSDLPSTKDGKLKEKTSAKSLQLKEKTSSKKDSTTAKSVPKHPDAVKTNKTTPKQVQDFGNLYEIPAVKIQSKPNPLDDLFADMEPTVQFSSKKSGSETDAEKRGDGKSEAKQGNSSGALSFAVDTSVDEDAGGWGDDDWGLDVEES